MCWQRFCKKNRAIVVGWEQDMLAFLALIGLYLLFLVLAGLVQALVLLQADLKEAVGRRPAGDVPGQGGAGESGWRSGGTRVLTLGAIQDLDQDKEIMIRLPCLMSPPQPEARRTDQLGMAKPRFKH